MPLLEIDNLSLTFETYLDRVFALDSLSFTIEQGKTVAIVGESGSGKSAAAQAILRLHDPNVAKIEKGKILYEGVNLLSLSEKEMKKVRGKEIGIIFQDPMTSLNPTLTIGKQVMEGETLLSKREAKEKALEMLQSVGISDPVKRFDQYPHQLSGGMRQRVMIAIALMGSPKLVIADEPTTALDVTIQAQIIDLMKRIQEKKKTSILLITHDLSLVAGIADQVLVMYAGTIIESGSVEEIFYAPTHPYTQALLQTLPRMDRDRKERLVPILGSPPHLSKRPSGCPFSPRCGHAMRICGASVPLLQERSSPTHKVACWKCHEFS